MEENYLLSMFNLKGKTAVVTGGIEQLERGAGAVGTDGNSPQSQHDRLLSRQSIRDLLYLPFRSDHR